MALKIYFCGSIHGGRQDAELYAEIINDIKSKYGEVVTEYVGQKDAPKAEIEMGSQEIHRVSLEKLQNCDAVVAEVTQPSLGVGYEIGRAVTFGKKILCLFRPDSGKNLSCMIRGLDNGDQVIVRNYQTHQYPQILAEFFQTIKS